MKLEDIALLEQERPKCCLWLPKMPVLKFFTGGIWEHSIDIDREEDEDPGIYVSLYPHALWLTYLVLLDIIQGMDPTFNDLGLAERRDPDALPPRNYFESVMNFLYNLLQALSRGNVLFALKAAMLTGTFALWL